MKAKNRSFEVARTRLKTRFFAKTGFFEYRVFECACLSMLAVVAGLLLAGPVSATEPVTGEKQQAAESTPAAKNAAPKIQLAILLDTSGSMNGLINQARTQLWR